MALSFLAKRIALPLKAKIDVNQIDRDLVAKTHDDPTSLAMHLEPLVGVKLSNRLSVCRIFEATKAGL